MPSPTSNDPHQQHWPNRITTKARMNMATISTTEIRVHINEPKCLETSSAFWWIIVEDFLQQWESFYCKNPQQKWWLTLDPTFGSILVDFYHNWMWKSKIKLLNWDKLKTCLDLRWKPQSSHHRNCLLHQLAKASVLEPASKVVPVSSTVSNLVAN